MLFVAYVKTRPEHLGTDFTERSRKWWNEGDRPQDMRVMAFYSALSTEAPNVIVFEADSADTVAEMIRYWPEIEFNVHPAQDLMEVFRGQGMQVG